MLPNRYFLAASSIPLYVVSDLLNFQKKVPDVFIVSRVGFVYPPNGGGVVRTSLLIKYVINSKVPARHDFNAQWHACSSELRLGSGVGRRRPR